MSYRIYAPIPAMLLREPIELGPLVFCTTQHLDRYDTRNDPQFAGLLWFAENYKTVQGQPLDRIGVLLIREGDFDTVTQAGLPRICRDVVALCHVTQGTVLKSSNASFPAVTSSDYFEISPVQFHDDRFTIHTPGLLSLHNKIDRFHPVFPLHLAWQELHAFRTDTSLLAILERSLREYTSGRNTRILRQVFRSLALCNHATRELTETETGAYDLGTRIVHWISAFEVLVHPGTGKVGLSDVLKLINNIQWPTVTLEQPDNEIARKASVGHRKFAYHKRNKRNWESAAAHYYRQLYNTRNDLAHGNRIRKLSFRVFGKAMGFRLDLTAPLLYRACLIERFHAAGIIRRPPLRPRTFAELRRQLRYEMPHRSFHEALAELLLTRVEHE